MKILVTGGAGYIGSHVVKLLYREFKEKAEILVLDNLSYGHKEAALYGKLVVGDIRDRNILRKIYEEFSPDVIMHFAAFISVPESVEKPLMYWENNVGGLISLLCELEPYLKSKKVRFVFSSTAAVYGEPESVPISEESKTEPINPYGQSKLSCEKMLRDFSSAQKNFSYVSLRYFNVAGADPEGELGQSYKNPIHLISRLLKVAKREFEFLGIYGTDYPTKDGTCIRDYIHVFDLASAHILAMNYLLDGGKNDVFNVGYCRGFSVLEVVRTAEKVIGRELPKRFAPRRPGDPAVLIADNKKIKSVLNFSEKYDDLEFIIKTAWNWELKRRY
ncbi:UDP-glucose 4-epimerase [bacterium HR19]|nr:UDP-glucose 4-epimerase [bacterium HR19]